ncbi:MAG: hypothetical protein ABI181_08125 [Mycobacteriaceae bacterium]
MAGAPRWWRREADESLVEARAAKGRAATMLLSLDTVQREVESQVEAYAEFSPGDGPRLSSTWTPLRDEAFAATGAYLQVEQYFDLDADLSADDARVAATEFDRVGRAMSDVAGRVRTFGEQAEPRFAQVRAALAQHTTLLRTLSPALDDARAAIAAAQQAGMRTTEPDEQLAAAEVEAARARQGDTVQGLRAAAEAAARATEHARAAAELARALPARKQEVARRITATRTRLQVSADRTAGLDSTMSQLRQRYAAAASTDLAAVPGEVVAALARAERGVFTARNAAAENSQRWAQAEQGLHSAREACEEAERAARKAVRRLEDLDAVAADPGPLLESTRRTVRDAQRFLLDSSPTLDRPLAARLDALAARLDRLQAGLRARRPDTRVDHWAYLHELQEVAAGAADIVAEVRERHHR